MSDRHPMYVGWFVHDGRWAKPDFHPPSRITFPKVRQRLTTADFDSLGPMVANQLANLLTPDGFVCIELTETNDNDLDAVTNLVKKMSCDVLGSTFLVSSLEAQVGDR